jgi:protein-L-isoaspartate(D-aspartate) O-methyltransferase
MVAVQLRARGIRDERVLDAMLAVPRHEFVPADQRGLSYADQPIAIGERQTISQPYMVASMLESLHLSGNEKVLEVGTGSGYAAAVLSGLVTTVYTVETHPSLASSAKERLDRLGFASVIVRTGDGSAGLTEAAPYDAIVVAAAAPIVPQPLIEQLAEGGRLVVPVGPDDTQILMLVKKQGGQIHSSSLENCRFVPLTGEYGFHE